MHEMIKCEQNRFQKGEIEFRVYSGWQRCAIPSEFTLVPYKAVYVDENDVYIHAFNFSMNYLNSIVTFADIKVGSDKFSKSEMRYLLGKTIEAAEKFTLDSGKNKIIVSSQLEAIIDVFVERDYIFRKQSNRLGHKGLKRMVEKNEIN